MHRIAWGKELIPSIFHHQTNKKRPIFVNQSEKEVIKGLGKWGMQGFAAFQSRSAEGLTGSFKKCSSSHWSRPELTCWISRVCQSESCCLAFRNALSQLAGFHKHVHEWENSPVNCHQCLNTCLWSINFGGH